MLQNDDKFEISSTMEDEEYYTSSQLLISSIDLEDADTYICIARNLVGQNMANATLDVQSKLKCTYDQNNIIYAHIYHTFAAPPDIVTPPADVTVNETDTLELTCEAFGIPLPTITWLTPIGVETIIAIKMNETAYTTTSTLTVENIDTNGEGVYTCMASNGIREDQQATATVTVQSKP